MTAQPRRPAERTGGLDRRKRTTRRPKSTVLIMTEGRRTEPDYLAARHAGNGRFLPDDNPSSGMFTLLDALNA